MSRELAVMGGEMPTRFRDFAQLEFYLTGLGRVRNALWFRVGHAMIVGEQQFGEKVYQAAELSGYNIESVRNFMSICRTITAEEYTPEVGMSQWQALSAVKDVKARSKLTERVLSGEVESRQELRQEISLIVENSHAGVRISTNGAHSPMTNGSKTRQEGSNAQIRACLKAIAPRVTAFGDALVWLDREIEKTGDYQAGSIERFRDAWDELNAAVVELEEKRRA